MAAGYPFIAIPAFLSAAGIAILRVIDGAHYPSDVLVGSAIGFAGARIVVRKIHEVPRWFYRATQRMRWGLIGLGSFALYVIVRTVVEKKPSVIILAAFVVIVTAVSVAASNRRSLMRFYRRCREDRHGHSRDDPL